MTFNLFKFFKSGSLYPKQPNKPVSQLLKDAQGGNADSQFKLGVLYRNTKIDDSEAAHWFRLAAEQGHSNAQVNLGFMYYHGKGVIQDYQEAMRWYRLAADQGHATAQNNIGLMYANGEGVMKDAQEAVRWLKLAADQEHAKVQN